MRYRLLCLILAVSAPGAADESAPSAVEHRLPLLSSVYPQGARAGETIRVELLGQHLDRAADALFSASTLQARLLSVSPTRIEAEFTVPATARFGHHQFRVVTPRGVSNPVLFRVGDLAHHLEREPNSRLDAAELVSLPATINGRLERDHDFDFFRFRAESGETWVFDLRAARNGNGLDAALILLDAAGRKLDHDEDTFLWDPFLVHTFARSGEFVAVVQPTHAHNDPNFAYQLDIRRSPHLSTVAPLAIRPGATTEITLFGHALMDAAATLEFNHPGISGQLLQARGRSATARITVPAGTPPGAYELTVLSPGRSNPATFLVDSTPAAAGARLSIPASVTSIARYRQPERFSFAAAAGERLVFEVRAMRFGSPVDSYLRLLDASGKPLAANDDGAFGSVAFNKDSHLVYTFPDAGEYQIEVRNLYAVTGEDFPYQLIVRRPQPSFELRLSTDQPFVHPGETRKVTITAERSDGYTDPIPLEVSGLPPGVLLRNPVEIAAGQTEADLELAASPDAVPGTFAAVTISAGGRDAWRLAQITSGGGEGRAWVRVEQAYLSVAEKPLFSLECAFTALNLVRGGLAELKVMIRRQAGFTDGIEFSADNLPAGVTLESYESGKELATLRFRAAADAETGRAARVSILGRAAGQLQAAPRISFQVD